MDTPKRGVGMGLMLAVLVAAHAGFTIGGNVTGIHTNHLDALGHLPWMQRWADPGLFPDDLTADYFQRHHVPIGLRGAYFVMMQWLGIELNIATRIVTVIWYATSIGLFIATVRLASRDKSWAITIAAIAAFLIPFDLTPLVRQSLFSGFQGGLARGAGPPVVLAALYGIARPSRWVSNLAIIVGAACYPPAMVIATAAAGIAALSAGSLAKVVRECLWLVPGVAIAGLIVWLWYPLGVDPRFGPLVSRDDIAWAPEIAHLHFPNGDSLAGIAVGWFKDWWAAIVAIALQASLYRGGRLLRANLVMLVTSAITTLVAYLIWPRLYEFDRYQLWPRCAVTFVAGSAVLAWLFEWISAKVAWLSVGRIACLALFGYLSFNVALNVYRARRARPNEAERTIFAQFGHKVVELLVNSTPDTKVAALGEELDIVATFARRSALLSPSALCPYHRDFHREAIRRYSAVQDAVYAVDIEPLKRLRDEFRVRYLSVHRQRFDPTKFEKLAGNCVTQRWLPERSEPITKLGSDRAFLFKNTPRDWIALELGDYQLIDLRKVP